MLLPVLNEQGRVQNTGGRASSIQSRRCQRPPGAAEFHATVKRLRNELTKKSIDFNVNMLESHRRQE